MATVIVMVGCYYGYTASGGPVGVGTATAKSMVLQHGGGAPDRHDGHGAVLGQGPPLTRRRLAADPAGGEGRIRRPWLHLVSLWPHAIQPGVGEALGARRGGSIGWSRARSCARAWLQSGSDPAPDLERAPASAPARRLRGRAPRSQSFRHAGWPRSSLAGRGGRSATAVRPRSGDSAQSGRASIEVSVPARVTPPTRPRHSSLHRRAALTAADVTPAARHPRHHPCLHIRRSRGAARRAGSSRPRSMRRTSSASSAPPALRSALDKLSTAAGAFRRCACSLDRRTFRLTDSRARAPLPAPRASGGPRGRPRPSNG